MDAMDQKCVDLKAQIAEENKLISDLQETYDDKQAQKDATDASPMPPQNCRYGEIPPFRAHLVGAKQIPESEIYGITGFSRRSLGNGCNSTFLVSSPSRVQVPGGPEGELRLDHGRVQQP